MRATLVALVWYLYRIGASSPDILPSHCNTSIQIIPRNASFAEHARSSNSPPMIEKVMTHGRILQRDTAYVKVAGRMLCLLSNTYSLISCVAHLDLHKDPNTSPTCPTIPRKNNSSPSSLILPRITVGSSPLSRLLTSTRWKSKPVIQAVNSLRLPVFSSIPRVCIYRSKLAHWQYARSLRQQGLSGSFTAWPTYRRQGYRIDVSV